MKTFVAAIALTLAGCASAPSEPSAPQVSGQVSGQASPRVVEDRNGSDFVLLRGHTRSDVEVIYGNPIAEHPDNRILPQQVYAYKAKDGVYVVTFEQKVLTEIQGPIKDFKPWSEADATHIDLSQAKPGPSFKEYGDIMRSGK